MMKRTSRIEKDGFERERKKDWELGLGLGVTEYVTS
jgi:hypothetical protein